MTDSTAEGLFKISSKDGVISVASSIDREVTGDTVILTVKVQLLFTLFKSSVKLNDCRSGSIYPFFFLCTFGICEL